MLQTKFQTSEASGSEGKDFMNIFHLFLGFKPRTLWGGAILYPTIWIHLAEDH